MRKLIAAAILFLASKSTAQIITVNENLATSSNTFLVDTNSPRLDVGTITYTGGIPGVVAFIGSNTVVGTGTGASNQVVIYATGTIVLNGQSVSTAGAGSFAPSSGSVVNSPLSGTGTSSNPISVVGISSKCASGQYLSTGTWVNGVATGGGCVVVPNGGGSSLSFSTGALTGGTTPFAMVPLVVLSSSYFNYSAISSTAGFISLSSGTAGTGWTRQVLCTSAGTTAQGCTSTVAAFSSGTYTTPAGVIQLRVRVWGGGGSGAGSDNVLSSQGYNGTPSSFNSVIANGGVGGAWNSGPSVGGSGGAGQATLRVAGSVGQTMGYNTNANGQDGPPNSGIGGGGGQYFSGTRGGGSGGNGEYFELVINNPVATYSYTVSTGAYKGTSAGDYNGGNGGSGVIIVDEMYPAIAPQGATGPTGATGSAGANGVSFNGGWTATMPSGNVYLTTATNNVGIGTASPPYSLFVGTGTVGIGVTVQNGIPSVVSVNNPVTSLEPMRIDGSPLILNLGGGNVGVNTKSPTTALSVQGLITSSTTIPTISCTSGSPTMTAGSTSQAGSYAAGALATGCTVTFTQAFNSNPFCYCQASANLLVYASATATNSVTCTAATAMTGDTIIYFCWGPP